MITHLLAHIGDRLLNANHVQGLDIADNRGNETLLSSHSDADIDVVAVDNSVAAVGTLDGSVDGGEIAHGKNSSARKGAHEAKLNAGLLENIVLVELTEFHDVGHVDLVKGGERGSGVLGLLEALSDSEAHAVHLDLYLRVSWELQ